MDSPPNGTRSGDTRPLVRLLGKSPESFQRSDLVRLCRERPIRVVNLRYPSLDGKLRELRVPVTDEPTLERVLATGERVDGSSLFPGLFPTGRSDLYVVPVYRWAFLDPWAEDELHLVCRYADPDGSPSTVTPDTILATAVAALDRRGLQLQALAELEFYLLVDREDGRFPGRAQRSYQQSAPYLRARSIADEILRRAADVIGRVKYCHSEVGYIDRLTSPDPELDGRRVEQYELELELMPIEDLATWLAVAKWLVRTVADRHRASATFVPKLEEGMAGSGMHLHLALFADGRNVMGQSDGSLSTEALALVGGLLRRAPALTALGNTVAASYLRLVPGQEAPTRLCWGFRNRSGLVRVPLSFRTAARLDLQFNPAEKGAYPGSVDRPTIEYRSPDASAFTALLLAGVVLAVGDGLGKESGLELAQRLEVEGDVAQRFDLELLPATAVAAADALAADRSFFEAGGFSSELVDHVIAKLRAEADEGLADRLRSLPAAERLQESRRLMHKDLHKH